MRLVVLFVVVLSLGMQDHDQQPAYCVNHGGFPQYPMVEPHVCACEHMDDGTEDRKCLVWCHKDKCLCIHEDDGKEAIKANFDDRDLCQRARAAILAAADRCSAVRLAARAYPPEAAIAEVIGASASGLMRPSA